MILLNKSYFLIVCLFFLFSCTKNEENQPNTFPKRMNYFSMEIDGKFWQPSFIDGDTCQQTFRGSQSGTSTPEGVIPFYNINAYQNIDNNGNNVLKNFIRMQIMDVTQVGEYNIKNSYKIHWDSFVSFEKVRDENGDDVKSIYTIDNTKNIFNFYVDELVDTNTLVANQGIIGRFEGILYNIENPLDSVIITNGKYKFTRLNWVDDCHCEK